VQPRARAPFLASSCIATLLGSGQAVAQSELDREHAAGFYVARSAAVVAVSGVSLATPLLFDVSARPAAVREWFPGDEGVRRNLSFSAARASDVSLLTTIAVPIVAQIAGGADARFANTTVVYFEALSANFLLNTVVKYTVQRPRPYTHRKEPAAVSYSESQGKDAYLSFYSGHAATAFSAAVAGSYMFAATHAESASRYWMWGTEFALAGATAALRVRAGKHYYSDVVVGAVVGSGVGIALPLLEGVGYRPTGEEFAFMGGGLVAGLAIAELVPFPESVPLAALGESIVVTPWIRSGGVMLLINSSL
jgi:membrane-associated phospholipid phosphatase